MSYVLNGGETNQNISGALSLDGFKFPIKEGLRGLYMFTRKADSVGINYADGIDARVVGHLTAGKGYCTFNSSNYVDTGLAETEDMTVVFSSGNESLSSSIFGNHESATKIGIAIYAQNATTISFNAQRSEGAGSTSIVRSSGFGLYSFKIPKNERSVAKNHTSGTVAYSTGSSPRVAGGAGSLKIGKLTANTFPNNIDLPFVAVFDRVLSDAELDLIVAWAREALSKYGITI